MVQYIERSNRLIIIGLAVLIGIILIGASCSQSTSQSETVNRATEKTSQTLAIDICRSTCASQKALGTDLTSGPCLNGEAIDDWVCDVAHSPRQKIDDEATNQCTTYRKGQTHHFVEVDPDCELIRAQ